MLGRWGDISCDLNCFFDGRLPLFFERKDQKYELVMFTGVSLICDEQRDAAKRHITADAL